MISWEVRDRALPSRHFVAMGSGVSEGDGVLRPDLLAVGLAPGLSVEA